MNSSNGINPFPGIRPFDVQEKYLFFGREDQTAELLTRLRKTRFLAVVGSSGSGKSSLVRAGLIPELHGGTMAAAGSAWEVAVMKPGGDPLTNLAKSLVDADLYDPDQEDVVSMIRASLSRSGMGLVDTIQQSDLESKTNLLIVVDQFEEIFRFRRMTGISEEEAGHFIRLLLEASQDESCPIYVVLTMRSDFLGDCAQFGGLAEAVNEGEYIIPRLNRNQRKQAIEAPSRVGGREMSNRLVQRLLNDISDDPDQLPILQHALMRTWEYWVQAGSEGPVDLEHYQATGGMTEALSRHADEVFQSLPDGEHRRIATLIFKSLTEKVSENRGIRRPMQLNELHEICGGDIKHLLHVIDEFRKTGCTFLMPAGESELQKHTIIDISHESLMRVWRTLRLWVDDEAQSAKIYRRLADTASLFKDGKAGFYRHPDLGIALAWRDENQPNQTWADRYYPGFAEAMAFLDKSQAEEEREGREKEEARKRELAQAQALAKAKERTARIFKAACVGVTVLAATSLYSMFEAQKSRDLAQKSIAEQALQRERAAFQALNSSKNAMASTWMASSVSLTPNNSEVKSNRITELIKILIKTPKTLSHVTTTEALRKANLVNDEILSITEESKLISVSNSLSVVKEQKLPFKTSGIIGLSEDVELIAYRTNNFINLYNTKKKTNIYTYELEEEVLTGQIPIKFSQNKNLFAYTSRASRDRLTVVNMKTSEKRTFKFSENLNDFIVAGSESIIFSLYSDSKLIIKKATLSGPLETLFSTKSDSRSCLLKKRRGNFYFIASQVSDSYKIYSAPLDTPKRISKTKNSFANIKDYEISRNKQSIVVLDNDYRLLITNFEQNSIDAYAAEGNEELFTTQLARPSRIGALSPDSAFVTVIEDSKTLSTYDLNNGNNVHGQIECTSNIISTEFLNDSSGLFIATEDGVIRKVQTPIFTTKFLGFFQSPFETLPSSINDSRQYKHYKLVFPKLLRDISPNISTIQQDDVGMQLSEIGLFTKDEERLIPEIDSIKSGSVGMKWGSYGSPKGEEANKLFDGSMSSKYFNFSTDDESSVKFSFKTPNQIEKIEFTSANDFLPRSPVQFELHASEDDKNYKIIARGPIENALFAEERDWLTRLLNSKSLMANVAYMSGLQISETGSPVPYNYSKTNSTNLHHTSEKLFTERMEFLGRINYQKKSHHIASHYFNKTSKSNRKAGPEYAQLLRLHGNCFAMLGDYKKAVQLLSQASNLSSNDWEILDELSSCYLADNNQPDHSATTERLIQTEIIGANRVFWNFRWPNYMNYTPLNLSNNSISSLKSQLANGFGAQNLLNEDLEINDVVLNENFKQDTLSLTQTLHESDSYIELNHNPLQFKRGITIEFWAKPGSDFGWIINYGGEGWPGWGSGMGNGFSVLQLSKGVFRFETANNLTGEKIALDMPFSAEGWAHYAFSWDAQSGMLKSYLNGQPVYNYEVTKDNLSYSKHEVFKGPIVLPSNKKIELGTPNTLSTRDYWNGSLTELRIWDHAVRDTMILNRFKERLDKPHVGLLCYAPLSGSTTTSQLSQTPFKYVNPRWELSGDLPDTLKVKTFAKLGRYGDDGQTTQDESTNFKKFLEFWSYIKIAEGKPFDALKYFSWALVGEPRIDFIEKDTFRNQLETHQKLKLALLFNQIGDSEKTKTLLAEAISEIKPSQISYENRREIFLRSFAKYVANKCEN